MTLFNVIKTKAPHLVRGEQAEQLAQAYLISQGLQMIMRNFRCRQGELDLIMREQHTLVIIEVRYRKNNTYGSAVESITQAKQQRIISATLMYLAHHPIDCPIRFDVLAITGTNQIEWIKNAFSSDD